MSNHHKTMLHDVTWCYLFNLRYGCKKANHSTLWSGLVGLLRILVICTDAAGCTDAGLVKHCFLNHGPAMTSNTQQYLRLIQFTSFYILYASFYISSWQCFRNQKSVSAQYQVEPTGCSLPPWPWDRELSSLLAPWVEPMTSHGTSSNKICLIHAATMLQLSPNKQNITLQYMGDYWSILEYMMLA